MAQASLTTYLWPLLNAVLTGLIPHAAAGPSDSIVIDSESQPCALDAFSSLAFAHVVSAC